MLPEPDTQDCTSSTLIYCVYIFVQQFCKVIYYYFITKTLSEKHTIFA